MKKPHRIQLKRKKGWRLPSNTVIVDRRTPWGNPFTLELARSLHPNQSKNVMLTNCIQAFKEYANEQDVNWLLPLRGKNLACWCPLNQPCHADVLLELANQ